MTNVLITAEEEHDCQRFVEDGREFHKECAENFRKIRNALHKAVNEIQGCPDSEVQELEFFRMAGYKSDSGNSEWKIPDQLF